MFCLEVRKRISNGNVTSELYNEMSSSIADTAFLLSKKYVHYEEDQKRSLLIA